MTTSSGIKRSLNQSSEQACPSCGKKTPARVIVYRGTKFYQCTVCQFWGQVTEVISG